MKSHKYLIYTPEGYCEAPNGEVAENFQVLGFSVGLSPADAVSNLLKENLWIAEMGYDVNSIEAIATI